jgi:hypothetical protein
LAILDNIPGWKVFSGGIGVAALCVVGYFAYNAFWAPPDDLPPLKEYAVDAAVAQVVEIYEKKTKEEGNQKVVVMPVKDDTTNDQIRASVLSGLTAAGIDAEKPKDPTLEERATLVFKELWHGDSESKDEVDPSRVFDDSPEVDEVLSIKVEKLYAGVESSVCKLNVYRIEKFTDSKTKTHIRILDPVQIKGMGGTAAEDDSIDPEEGPGIWSSVGGFLWRALVVLAFALFFPFLVAPGLRAVFRQDNNLLNAGVWLFLTSADIVLIFALVSFSPGTATIVGASILLPCALFYNLKAMNYIEEQV